jgi:hypothetical protein
MKNGKMNTIGAKLALWSFSNTWKMWGRNLGFNILAKSEEIFKLQLILLITSSQNIWHTLKSRDLMVTRVSLGIEGISS